MLALSVLLACTDPPADFWAWKEARRGEYHEVDGSGHTRVSGTFEDGFREGEWLKYSSGGILIQKVSYVRGEKHGLETLYRSSGIVQSRTEYIAGKRNGMERLFDKNGRLRAEVPYANGEREGWARFFREDGSLTERVHFSAGRLVESQCWDSVGQLEAESKLLDFEIAPATVTISGCLCNFGPPEVHSTRSEV